MKTALTFLILLVSTFAYSQQIDVCTNYSEDGAAIGANTVWNISPSGGALYLLFNNGGYAINTNTIYIYIDRQAAYDSEYTTYKTLTIPTYEDETWVASNFTFTEPGNYKISFLNQNSQTLATTYCTIKLKNATASVNNNSSVNTNNNTTADTYYYTNSSIKFYTTNDDSKSYTKFNISPSGGWVKIKLDNSNKALKSKKLYFDFYTGSNYDQFVETKSYEISPAWANFNFNYSFQYVGNYMVKVYNDNNVLINIAYVNTLKKQ
jgi:hypothetical protein